MKKLLSIIFVLISISLSAQQLMLGQAPPTTAAPTTFMYADASRFMRVAQVDSLKMYTKQIRGLRDTIGNRIGLLTYSKSQSDLRYLQSFTETDPLSVHISDSNLFARKTYVSSLYQLKGSYITDTTALLRKATADGLYQLKGSYLTSEVDPSVPSYSKSLTTFSVIKSSTDALYYPVSGNPSGFLTSYTETDPTVSAGIKAITGTNISNWNTSFGWGNHNGLYVLLSGSYSNPSWITSLAYSKISGAPTLATVATTGAYSDLTGKPTIPTLKRQETYSGTSNSSGNYTVTFGTAYSVAPNIQANIIGGTNTQTIKITSVSTTGFTVNVTNRNEVLGLLPTYTNVNGASVDVLITEK